MAIFFIKHAGIPQQPATPRGLSRRVGEIVLALSTQEAGINKSLHSIMFLVNASRMTTSEAPELVKRTMTIEGYIDGIEVEFLVPGLVGGERYTFDVTVRNNFGESAVSESSLAVQVAREGGIYGCACVGQLRSEFYLREAIHYCLVGRFIDAVI